MLSCFACRIPQGENFQNISAALVRGTRPGCAAPTSTHTTHILLRCTRQVDVIPDCDPPHTSFCHEGYPWEGAEGSPLGIFFLCLDTSCEGWDLHPFANFPGIPTANRSWTQHVPVPRAARREVPGGLGITSHVSHQDLCIGCECLTTYPYR